MGYVQQVNVQVGDRVREGQLLVVLDARDLDAERPPRRGRPRRSRERHPEAENGVAAAKANLDLAQATFKRMEDLVAKKSISNQEFDEAAARLKAAQANYEMARSRRAQLDSRIAQAEQEVRAAGIMRDYAKIAAPFAGVVTARIRGARQPGAPGRAAAHHRAGGRLPPRSVGGRIAAGRPCASGQAVEVVLEALDRKLDAPRLRDRAGGGRRLARLHREDRSARRAAAALRHVRPRRLPAGRAKRARRPAAAVVERGQLQSVFVAGRRRGAHAAGHHRTAHRGPRRSALRAQRRREGRGCPCPPASPDGARVEVRQ